MTNDHPVPAISSAANPRLKAIGALRDRRARERTGRLLVDGAREVVRTLDAGVVIEEAFVVEPMPADVELAAAAARLAASGVPITTVSPEALGRIAYGDRASGIVAVVVAPPTDLQTLATRLPTDTPALVAVVEDVEKPGNLGAVCRSADGAGFHALIAASARDPGADPWNPNAVRASVGTVFSLPVAVAGTDEVLAFLRAQGLQVVAARVDGSVAYTEPDLTRPTALVLGSEARGLTDAWHVADVVGVCLPMLGRADSLNVAAAAAILFYEARRQRDRTPG
jgi:RNA methyltransferase, TrmH family